MKIVRTVWNLITTVVVALVLVLAMLLVGSRVVGLQAYTVLSGSMEPVYHTGSVIYVKEVDPQTLQAGDVITYHLTASTVATHRITEVIEEDGKTRFRTKGDANAVEDGGSVSADSVIGSPVFTIPYLGYLAAYIQTPSGKFMSMTVGAVVLLLMLIPELLFPADKEKPGKNAAEE